MAVMLMEGYGWYQFL